MKLWYIQIAFATMGAILFIVWMWVYHPDSYGGWGQWFLSMMFYWFLLLLSELITWKKK